MSVLLFTKLILKPFVSKIFTGTFTGTDKKNRDFLVKNIFVHVRDLHRKPPPWHINVTLLLNSKTKQQLRCEKKYAW